MVSFEKFLKKEGSWDFLKDNENPIKDKVFFNGLIKGRDRFIEDLGEWAWQALVDDDVIDWFFDEEFEHDVGTFLEFADRGEFTLVYIGIAVACLGKKEVEKRLKTLGVV